MEITCENLNDQTYTGTHGWRITFDWLCNAGGAVQATTTKDFCGFIRTVITNPFLPLPTDNYDVQLWDENEADLAEAALLNRDTVNSECVTLDPPPMFAGKLTLRIDNAGNARRGTVVVYISGP